MLTKGQIISIVALLNGMLGGTILVLPLIGINTGYLIIPLITIYFGSLSGYTTYLLVIHIGHSKTLKSAVTEHFHGKRRYSAIYSVVLAISIIALLISYFQLLIKQIQGFVQPSPWIGIFSLVFCTILTFVMLKLDVGDKLMAIGIISIIGYILFLIWAQTSAPSGEKKINPVQPQYIDLAAALIMGYAIQNLVDQVIIKNTEPENYVKVVKIIAVLGIFAYTFISYGCYSIINRQPRVQIPQTIQEYFAFGGWQVGLIEVLYFIHLISAIPEFCIIAKFRILQVITSKEDNENEQQDEQNMHSTSHSITLPEIIIIIIINISLYVIYATGVKIATIIQLNGSIIGYLYVILFPIILHLKCVYFDKHDENGVLVYEKYDEKEELIEVQGKCKCKIQYTSNFTKYLELVYLMIGLGVGLYTVYYTLYIIFNQPETPIQSSEL